METSRKDSLMICNEFTAPQRIARHTAEKIRKHDVRRLRPKLRKPAEAADEKLITLCGMEPEHVARWCSHLVYVTEVHAGNGNLKLVCENIGARNGNAQRCETAGTGNARNVRKIAVIPAGLPQQRAKRFCKLIIAKERCARDGSVHNMPFGTGKESVVARGVEEEASHEREYEGRAPNLEERYGRIARCFLTTLSLQRYHAAA